MLLSGLVGFHAVGIEGFPVCVPGGKAVTSSSTLLHCGDATGPVLKTPPAAGARGGRASRCCEEVKTGSYRVRLPLGVA